MTHLLIFSAVQAETAALESCIQGSETHVIGRRRLMSGRLEGREIRLLVTGPGAANTLQAVTACIERDPPAMMIQTGIAGAFGETRLQVGDLAVATEEIDVQLGIEPEAEDAAVVPLPFAVLAHQGATVTGRYPLPSRLVATALDVLRRRYQGREVLIQAGPFVTVATVTATEKRARRLFHQYGACMEAMEGAAAAHLSLHYDIPLLEIRAASNMTGRRDLTSWNIPLACSRCSEAVRIFLQETGPEAYGDRP
ncbi:MAG: futalosine hydrolase [Thermodesulfobacteriota bacterium]